MDNLYKGATYISNAIESDIIRTQIDFAWWIIGTSNISTDGICYEALDIETAKIVMEFLSKRRSIEVDPESKEGKYVYVRKKN